MCLRVWFSQRSGWKYKKTRFEFCMWNFFIIMKKCATMHTHMCMCFSDRNLIRKKSCRKQRKNATLAFAIVSIKCNENAWQFYSFIVKNHMYICMATKRYTSQFWCCVLHILHYFNGKRRNAMKKNIIEDLNFKFQIKTKFCYSTQNRCWD